MFWLFFNVFFVFNVVFLLLLKTFKITNMMHFWRGRLHFLNRASVLYELCFAKVAAYKVQNTNTKYTSYTEKVTQSYTKNPS